MAKYLKTKQKQRGQKIKDQPEDCQIFEIPTCDAAANASWLILWLLTELLNDPIKSILRHLKIGSCSHI